jgi:hypothetical protein
MYLAIANLLSLFIIGLYIYNRTKDKIFIWVFIYTLINIIGVIIYKVTSPDVPFYNAICNCVENYLALFELCCLLAFFIFFAAPILVLIPLIYFELEKRKMSSDGDFKKTIGFIVKPNKTNCILWGMIITVNLIALFLDYSFR